MAYRIRVASYADGRPLGPLARWLGPKCDVNAHGGRGYADLVAIPAHAATFDSQAEAHAFWTQVSTKQPIDYRGEPNRPLCAFTVLIEPVPEED